MYQWFCCSRNIGQVTPKIIRFRYLEKILDQSIQETFYLFLKTEALTGMYNKSHIETILTANYIIGFAFKIQMYVFMIPYDL